MEAELGQKFDHFQSANFLLRTPENFLDDIDDATKDQFGKLFVRLNGLLS